jgi:hypothetical protein
MSLGSSKLVGISIYFCPSHLNFRSFGIESFSLSSFLSSFETLSYQLHLGISLIATMTPAIPLNSVVLVTGVNGFIGSHVANELILAGYRVRGTVRKVSKADGLKAFWEKKYGPGKVEIVEVPEMGTKGAFDEAVKGMFPVQYLHKHLLQKFRRLWNLPCSIQLELDSGSQYSDS